MLIGNSKDPNAYLRVMAAVDKKLKKYGVFDLKGYKLGFQENTCNQRFPCPRLVILYARMGLHCYNLMRGTKFQLSRVNKYIKSTGSAASSYYMTLDAMDPTGSLQTFQTKVSEESFGEFILTCNIARIRDDRKGAMYAGAPFPEWPPENPFENHYLVKESELQDNDWIRLYLELAVATTGDREGLSELEIVNVAIDDERLNAKNATLYIRYNDLSEASDRIAIVRRSFDDDTGRFLLMGLTRLSSEIIPIAMDPDVHNVK